MKLRILLLLFALPVVALTWLTGCGTGMGSGSGTGYGPDAGPWPQAPTRSAGEPASPNAQATASSTLLLLIQGKAASEEEVRLDIAQIDLKYDDKWQPVAKRGDMAKTDGMPLRFGPKGNTVLLTKVQIPRRKYTHLRVQLSDKQTQLISQDVKHPLTIESTTFSLGNWTPDATRPNAMTIMLDGTKVTKNGESGTLPAEGISVQTTIPAGGISGSLVPSVPNAKVEAYWANSKVMLASVTPGPQDGAFTLENLPAGSYRLEVRAPGHKLIEPLKDLVMVEGKVTAVKAVTLTEDAGVQ